MIIDQRQSQSTIIRYQFYQERYETRKKALYLAPLHVNLSSRPILNSPTIFELMKRYRPQTLNSYNLHRKFHYYRCETLLKC